MKPRLSAKWLILPPLLLGIAIFAMLYRSRAEPGKISVQIPPPAMRVMLAERSQMRPRVRGFGSASPSRTWRAVSEVRGRIIQTHPELRAGTLIAADAELLRIDPSEHQLALARSKAARAQAQAQLDELSAREKNLAASLAIEEKALVLASASYERRRKLMAEGVAAADEADGEHRKFLAQERTVQELRSSQTLLPASARGASGHCERPGCGRTTGRAGPWQARYHCPVCLPDWPGESPA